MTSFGKAERLGEDAKLPHHGRKSLTTEILSHEKEECKFRPDLPPDSYRDKVAKANYGKEYVPPKPKEVKEVDEKAERKTFKPDLNVGKNGEILRQMVPSTRYGKKAVKNIYESRAAKKNELRPKPNFQPKVNKGRLRSEIPSSGYADGAVYKPGKAKRGDVARRPDAPQFSFQPQLHLSKRAKELAKSVKKKYPKGKRVSQDEWHARPREPRVYSPKKWEGPSAVVVAAPPKYQYADESESYDTGGFILDSVAFSTRGSAEYSSMAGYTKTGGYRGAHLDADMNAIPFGRRKAVPKARPKTTEYDMHGRPKGEPIFDPDSILGPHGR
mmetsp:Transcript_37251/g.97658  ORF Transcript_37251/g.97658 Transcript_37251/m.97658 type:complete len:328 (+) Transcript_37251:293-1276(+)